MCVWFSLYTVCYNFYCDSAVLPFGVIEIDWWSFQFNKSYTGSKYLAERWLPLKWLFATGQRNSCFRPSCVLSLLLLQVFCEVAYRADNVQNILDGIDEFLDELIVLPPSIWDPNTRLEPPITTRSKVLIVYWLCRDVEVFDTHLFSHFHW